MTMTAPRARTSGTPTHGSARTHRADHDDTDGTRGASTDAFSGGLGDELSDELRAELSDELCDAVSDTLCSSAAGVPAASVLATAAASVLTSQVCPPGEHPDREPAVTMLADGSVKARRRTGMYGPRGWTVVAGVWEVIERARDELRATVIPTRYGLSAAGHVRDGAPTEDFNPFHDLGPAEAARLLEILPPRQLADRQNLGPTLGSLLRACAGAGGRVRLSGYAIGPQRRDERVTVEGLWLADADLRDVELCEDHAGECRCRQVWHTVRDRYDLEGTCPPDEIRHLPRWWDHGEVGTWLWWD